MSPALGPCALCGRPAKERHHVTARLSADGPYLDPHSTIALCRRCHVTEGQLWRDVGLDVIDCALAARVRRATWTVGRLADVGRPFPAESMRGLHGVLVVVQDEVLSLVGEGASE